MPKHIDAYSFGTMTIAGRAHTSDMILHPGRIDDKWWRAQGHHCCLADLGTALGAHPKRLIVGTGEPGLMAVADDLVEHCRVNGIELTVLPTARAVDSFNGCPDKTSTIAAFHLTC